MRKYKRKIRFLSLGIALLIGVLYLIFNFSPTHEFLIEDYKLQIIYPAFLLLFFSLYFIFAFIFANKRRGLFISLFAVIYLVLRMNNLAHPLFFILLLILFTSLELFYYKRG